MRHFASSLLGALLGAALFVGCSGGGSSNAPEGAGLEGSSSPANMATPPPAEIDPDATEGAPPSSAPTTSP